MSVSAISNREPPAFRMMDCGKRTGSGSFAGMLSEAQENPYFLYLPRENTVYSGGRGSQTVYAEYTQDSTPEDPVLLVKGACARGEYEFTCRLNDIDLHNASYAELCALWGHLKVSGQAPELGYPQLRVLPDGIDVGDVSAKRDYAALIQGMTTSTVFDASNQRDARALLDLYQGWNRGERGLASLADGARGQRTL